MIDERHPLFGMHWALPVTKERNKERKKKCIGHRGRLRLSHLRPGACDMKRRSPVLGIIDATRQELTGNGILVCSDILRASAQSTLNSSCILLNGRRKQSHHHATVQFMRLLENLKLIHKLTLALRVRKFYEYVQ
jgi:hypothetical protein